MDKWHVLPFVLATLGNHWDDVISKYKEIEFPYGKAHVTLRTMLERIEKIVISETKLAKPLLPVHVIDLSVDGFIG